MAWDGYINQNIVQGGLVDKAILIDMTGQSVWGKSAGIELSAAEMSQIASAFNNPASAQEKGITVGGNKYFFNKIDELENIPVLHCAKGKEGIIAAKCSQSILVSHYPDTAPPGKAIDFVQTQAKHLIANNL